MNFLGSNILNFRSVAHLVRSNMGVQTDRQTGVLTFTTGVSLCGRLKYKIWALLPPSVEHYSSIDCCSRRPTNIDLTTVRPENISLSLAHSVLRAKIREILDPKSTLPPSGLVVLQDLTYFRFSLTFTHYFVFTVRLLFTMRFPAAMKDGRD